MSLFTGTNLIDLDEVESTNNYALNLLKEKRPFEGTVVRTFKQTSGRGQRHKHWESEEFVNLTFSIIYFPVFLSVENQFQLSKAVALGISDFVKKIVDDAAIKIKWPNDIYIEDKKVAGILIENSVNSNKISSSVIGIGININQTAFNSQIPNPISLKMITEKTMDLEICFYELCAAIETRYMQLKLGRRDEINITYHQRLYLLNTENYFLISGDEQQAEIVGVNEQGKLKLKTASGMIECGFHEISYLH